MLCAYTLSMKTIYIYILDQTTGRAILARVSHKFDELRQSTNSNGIDISVQTEQTW